MKVVDLTRGTIPTETPEDTKHLIVRTFMKMLEFNAKNFLLTVTVRVISIINRLLD